MRRILSKFRNRKRSKGDTLVEVLIALGIISTVLAGAFVVTHRSTNSVRDAQEHHIALELAQAQIDKLRLQAKSGSSIIFGGGGDFCIISDTAVTAATNPSCKVDESGNPTTIQPIYSQAISYNSDINVFTATVNWQSINGGTDNVQLAYRLFPPTSAGPSGSTDFGFGTPPCTVDCGGDGGGGDDGGGGGVDPEPPPPPPEFHWNGDYWNDTDPSETSLITGCSWDFGDGTAPEVNQACLPGDIINHTFVPPAGFSTTYDESLCGTAWYDITLITHLSNGLNPSKTHADNWPACY